MRTGDRELGRIVGGTSGFAANRATASDNRCSCSSSFRKVCCVFSWPSRNWRCSAAVCSASRCECDQVLLRVLECPATSRSASGDWPERRLGVGRRTRWSSAAELEPAPGDAMPPGRWRDATFDPFGRIHGSIDLGVMSRLGIGGHRRVRGHRLSEKRGGRGAAVCSRKRRLAVRRAGVPCAGSLRWPVLRPGVGAADLHGQPRFFRGAGSAVISIVPTSQIDSIPEGGQGCERAGQIVHVAGRPARRVDGERRDGRCPSRIASDQAGELRVGADLEERPRPASGTSLRSGRRTRPAGRADRPASASRTRGSAG